MDPHQDRFFSTITRTTVTPTSYYTSPTSRCSFVSVTVFSGCVSITGCVCWPHLTNFATYPSWRWENRVLCQKRSGWWVYDRKPLSVQLSYSLRYPPRYNHITRLNSKNATGICKCTVVAWYTFFRFLNFLPGVSLVALEPVVHNDY